MFIKCFKVRYIQQMPSLEVLEISVAGAGGVEQQRIRNRAQIGERDDVPEIEWDDEQGEEIDLGGGVSADFFVGAAGDGVAQVGAARAILVLGGLQGGFDLDAAKDGALLDDEVVAGGIAPGLGDGQSVGGGAGHELQFDPFAAAFGVAEAGEHKSGSRWWVVGSGNRGIG